MEANTGHNRAVAGGRLSDRLDLRARLVSLVGSQNGEASRVSAGKADPVAASFDHWLRDSSAVALHHRRLPGSGSEISHLVIGPPGVTVVDSHGYKASSIQLNGGGGRGSARRRSNRLKHLLSQVEDVRRLLAATPYAKVPIEAAVAQRKVSGPRVLQGINSPRVILCGTRTIAGEASRRGSLSTRRVRRLAAYLDDVLG